MLSKYHNRGTLFIFIIDIFIQTNFRLIFYLTYFVVTLKAYGQL